MRLLPPLIVCFFLAVTAAAQRVQVYGKATQGGRGAPGVMILVFEGDKFIKKLVTDKTGTYRFYTHGADYTILYYKPGTRPKSYHIINQVMDEMVKFPVDLELDGEGVRADSLVAEAAAVAGGNPHFARMYLTAVYEYEKHTPRKDTLSRNTRRALIRQAVAERERFINYKKATRSSASDSTQRTIITIGPDTYVEVTDAKGAKRYYKNEKPVTEITYRFETTRRYEGVLKNKRDVRRFEKYDAMKHVR